MFPIPFEHKVAMKTFEKNANIRFSRIDGDLVACDALTEDDVFLNMYKKYTKDFVIERKIPAIPTPVDVEEGNFLGFFHKSNPINNLSVARMTTFQVTSYAAYFDSETLNFFEFDGKEEETIQHKWIQTQ